MEYVTYKKSLAAGLLMLVLQLMHQSCKPQQKQVTKGRGIIPFLPTLALDWGLTCLSVSCPSQPLKKTPKPLAAAS
jgi:hypothetical protein